MSELLAASLSTYIRPTHSQAVCVHSYSQLDHSCQGVPLDSLTRCINCGWTNVPCAFHSCATASARGSLGRTNFRLRGVRR